MKAKLKSDRTIRIDDFYRSSWRTIIAILAWLVTVSGSGRPQFVLPFYILAFLLVTRWAGFFRDRQRAVSYILYAAMITMVIDQAVTYDGLDKLIRSLIELVSGFLPLSLLRAERARSYWFAILNVAVVSIGCVTFSSTIFVYAAFSALIVAMILNMNAANLGLRDERGERAVDWLPRAYFQQFFLVVPVGLFSAAVIFLSFPRVQSIGISLGNLVGRNQTGYSGAINLSADGEISESKTLALMVQNDDHKWLRVNAGSILFRGDSLDTFDGTNWSSTVFDYKPIDALEDQRVSKKHERVIQALTMHMEPGASNSLFYPGALFDASNQSLSPRRLLINSVGSLVREGYEFDRVSYRVRVAPTQVIDASSKFEWSKLFPDKSLAELQKELESTYVDTARPSQISKKMATTYLTTLSEKVGETYFSDWQKEVAIDPSIDTAVVALEKLRTNFSSKFNASLKNQFKGKNTLQAFLSETREGHCEYFATASALLWRRLGFPARVVVGYRGGTYNDYIDALEVREENAHAWVEIYFPSSGWVTFDPTPASADLTASSGLAMKARLWANAASFFFRQYVVDYDYRTQRDLIMSLRSLGQRGEENDKTKEGSGFDRENLAVAIVVLAVLALIVLIVMWFRRRKSEDIFPPYYLAFQRLVERLGIERERTESLASFHQRLLHIVPEPHLVKEVHAAIERDLYADQSVDDLNGPNVIDSREQSALLQKVRAASWKAK